MSSDINTAALGVVIAALFFSAAGSMFVGGIVSAARSTSGTMRVIAISAIVGGLALALTGVLGAAEILESAPFKALVFFEAGLLAAVFWAAVLVDCAVKEAKTGNDKLVWVIIIVFTQVLGAAMYLIVRRPRRLAEA